MSAFLPPAGKAAMLSPPRKTGRMDGNDPARPPKAAPPNPPDDRLDSWKEIAAHLRRDESTVRRWEKDGLPVHRHHHKFRAAVFAYKSELDAWWNAEHEAGETSADGNGPPADPSASPAELTASGTPPRPRHD